MTSLRGRSAAVVGGGVAAMVLSAGAVAWACTPYEAGSEAAEEYAAQNPPQSQDRSGSQQPQPAAEAQPVSQPQPQPRAEPQPVSQASSTPAPAVNRSAAPSRSASAGPSAATRRAVRPAPATASAAPAAPAAQPAPVAPAPEPAAPLPSMGASGDLWSGFTAGLSTATSGPSLTDAVPAGSAGRGADWAVGVGLLSAGLVALGAGAGVSAVRRSRVPTGSGAR